MVYQQRPYILTSDKEIYRNPNRLYCWRCDWRPRSHSLSKGVFLGYKSQHAYSCIHTLYSWSFTYITHVIDLQGR